MSSINGNHADELTRNAARLGKPGKLILNTVKFTSTVNGEYLIKYLLIPAALQWFNGVLLDKETFYQKTTDGYPLVDVLKRHGVLPGILLKMNLDALPDGLAECFQKYYEDGARFAILDFELEVDPGQQSQSSIDRHANILARYASILQENGMVPIVEPYILLNRSDDIHTFANATEHGLAAYYKALNDHRVLPEGTLINPNKFTRGFEALKVNPLVTADYTLRSLKRTVPAAVPAVVLSHGELGEEESTLILKAITEHNTNKPWSISSIGTLDPTMFMDFAGDEESIEINQAAFTRWCKEKAETTILMPEESDTVVMPGDGGFIRMPRVGSPFPTAFVMPRDVANLRMLGDGSPVPSAFLMPRNGANFSMLGGGGQFPGAFMMPGDGANFGMPGGGSPFPGISAFVMPGDGANSGMPGDGANSGMPGGNGPFVGTSAFVMPEDDANFEMPGRGHPVPDAAQNLRPAGYIYKLEFGFNVRCTFSAGVC